jgi:cysteine desulfurase
MAQINFTPNSGWTKEGSYYYYDTDLAKGATTSSLITGVTLNCDANLDTTATAAANADGVYANANYKLKITAQAIEAESKADWGKTLYNTITMRSNNGVDNNIDFSQGAIKESSSPNGAGINLRSGTENVAGLVGFSTAAKIAKDHVNGNRKKFEKLNKIFRDTLVENLEGKIEPKFLGNQKRQLANFVPVCFDGLDAERLIFKLEDEKIYVSTGAACAASKGEKSHVLTAIGLTDSEIAGSLRISMGATNDEVQVKTAASKLAEIVKKELERIHG